jgi:hypothetical protein
MNNPQGITPINGQMSYREEPTMIAPADFPRPRISELIEQKLHVDGNSLAKEALFSCHKCHGALVPYSECPVCSRTSFRKCTRCKNEVPNGSHQSCEYLILLRELRANQRERPRKN